MITTNMCCLVFIHFSAAEFYPQGLINVPKHKYVNPSSSSLQGPCWNIWQSVGGGQWNRSSVSASGKASRDPGAPLPPSPILLDSARSGPQPPSGREGTEIGWRSGLHGGVRHQAAPWRGHPSFPLLQQLPRRALIQPCCGQHSCTCHRSNRLTCWLR